MNKPKIILASASIGRKMLLEKLGIPFDIAPSNIDEEAITDTNPVKKLQRRAQAKADNVVKKLETYNLQPTTYNFLLIAADSEAILNGKTYGKARNKTHAKEIVRTLMGESHDFVTATSIVLLKLPKRLKNPKIGNRWENITKTRVTTRKMPTSEIDQYVNRYDFTRFAAGYALNETPWDWVTKIDGSYTNVVGLPFEIVLPIFRQFDLLL